MKRDTHRGWQKADPVRRSRRARTKFLDTLVDIPGDAASDAGSTPAASTKLNAVSDADSGTPISRLDPPARDDDDDPEESGESGYSCPVDVGVGGD